MREADKRRSDRRNRLNTSSQRVNGHGLNGHSLNGKSRFADPGDIHRAMDAGADYEALCERFGRAALERPLKKILHRKPALKMPQAFGHAAASDKRIIIDVCMGASIELTRCVYERFGIPQSAEYFMEGTGEPGRAATDNQIIKKAIAKGMDAIFTYDGRRGDRYDLCRVAERKFGRFNPEEHGHVPPAVVVLPSNKGVVEVLSHAAGRIQSYLDQHVASAVAHQAHVLDLRSCAA